MNIFNRYAPFIRDFIYQNNWESLRAIQVAAGDAVFNTDDNLLLSASTASGKTEAAFFPILTLFNDLCREADIPVWHWHGDVAQSRKSGFWRIPPAFFRSRPNRSRRCCFTNTPISPGCSATCGSSSSTRFTP